MDDEPIISLHDTHGRVLWANRAPPPATLDDLIGSWPWQWVPVEEKESVKAYFAKCIALQEPQEFESLADVHGVSMHLHVRLDPIGGTVFPMIARTRVLDSRVSLLTTREREVAVLTANGLSAKEIGRRLEISASTVDTHRARIRAKLRLRTIADIGMFAMKNLHS